MSMPSSNRWSAWLTLTALASAALVLGGCSLAFPLARHWMHPEKPMSDAQSISEVVGPAKQIARSAQLPDVSGSFSWASCNDQGGKPYRGRVDMTFIVPKGLDHSAYFEQIAKTMEANGWSAGPPPGLHVFGTTIHQNGVMGIIGVSPFLDADGAVQLFGQCRNMSDHRLDEGFSIKDQLRTR